MIALLILSISMFNFGLTGNIFGMILCLIGWTVYAAIRYDTINEEDRSEIV